MSDSLLPELEALARRAGLAEGLEVAWVELKRQGGSQVFRVFIEREDGSSASLADCERLSQRLGVLLDVEDPIEAAYLLEISTPGLDRPLRNEGDYARFQGRLARIKTRTPLDGRRRFLGRLAGVQSGAVIIEDEEVGEVQVPFSEIESGRLEVEFGRPAQRSGSRNPHSQKTRKRERA
jgi:ribosome maturation factor RimP